MKKYLIALVVLFASSLSFSAFAQTSCPNAGKCQESVKCDKQKDCKKCDKKCDKKCYKQCCDGEKSQCKKDACKKAKCKKENKACKKSGCTKKNK